MQKSNKIILRVVAALLCLVLITTSVVSGIFARFAIKKSVGLNVELERLGVTVSLEVDQALYDAADVQLKSEGGQISVTIDNLKMAPGDDFTDMIHFNFSGEANTRCKVMIDVDFDYNFDDWVVWGVGGAPEEIYDDDGNLVNPKKAFLPFEFTCNNSPTNATIDSTIFSNASSSSFMPFARLDDPEYALVYSCVKNNLLDDVTLTGIYAMSGSDSEKTDMYLEKIFELDSSTKKAEIYFHRKGEAENVKTKDLYFGFYWPFEISGNRYNINAIQTWLVTNRPDTKFGFTYTVSVEQVSDSYVTPRQQVV